MDTLDKIRNTMKSFEGRMKALEKDPDLDLKGYCDRASSLEHDFYKAVKNILKAEEREKAENVSSVNLATRYGLID